MPNTSVIYLGRQLDNPIVVSSSSLTDTPDKVKRCEAAGAGAVVLKSLFEEQIEAEIARSAGVDAHTEADDYIRAAETTRALDDYLALIRDSVAQVDIPVYASLNAVTTSWWIEQASRLVDAGAAGLELNIAYLPTSREETDDAIARRYAGVVSAVAERVTVPIAVKIGPHFSSIPAMVDRMRWAGASAVVLFNRFYRVDIDVESLSLKPGVPHSSEADLSVPLRWIAILHGRAEVELVANSGVHDWSGVVKALLAGAQTVQVCSTLYKNGLDHIAQMRDGLAQWMERKSYEQVDQFRGFLSRSGHHDVAAVERLQYLQALTTRQATS